MIYRPFGKVADSVSAVGMGTWNIGGQWGEMTDELAIEIVKSAYEHGVTVFDTAETYGDPHGISEIRLGKALKDIRDKVVIVSKIGYWGFRQGETLGLKTVDSIRLCGHAICGRLQTSCVDVILCHHDMIEDPSVFIDGFECLIEEGFLKHYGISTNNFDVLKNFYEVSKGRCSVVELDYSLANKQPEEEILPFCMEHGIAVLARGPLGMGVLSGKFDENTVFTDAVRAPFNEGGEKREKFLSDLAVVKNTKEVLDQKNQEMSLAEAAVKYIISHPAGVIAIPGMTTISQVEKNTAAGATVFTPEEFAKL
ncbi:MAG: aldo/keto reductase [Lachnospiraceae bacterium]